MPATTDITVMTPEELCYLVHDLVDEHLYGVTGMCAQASIILACLLRERGLDARLMTGSYLSAPGSRFSSEEEHAYVVLGDIILDPTRDQFEELPLVDTVGASQYQGEDWGDDAPCERPTLEDLAAYIDAAFPALESGAFDDEYLREGFLRICRELGLLLEDPGL